MTRRKRMFLIGGALALAVVLAGLGAYYMQATRFNPHASINGIAVGGLTAGGALDKLSKAEFKHIVTVGSDEVVNETDTTMVFHEEDLQEIKGLIRRQLTGFPSFASKAYQLTPKQPAQVAEDPMRRKLEEKLVELNKSLKAPKDAEVRLEHGQIVVTPSENGQQYDVAKLLEDYQKAKQSESGTRIALTPQYLQPKREDDPTLLQQKEKLQELAQRTVDYKVQDQVYTFRGSDLVRNASVSKDLSIRMDMDPEAIKKKLNEINEKQSTLNKNYTFQTHSGTTISVKGETYGWALDVDAEAGRIREAFEQKTGSIKAYNVYGIGWNVNGVGYHTLGTDNHGIGDTYVEVSIQEQRMWVYKNGELKVTTPVVTGKHKTKEDTPPGVWYLHYKKSPSVLKGSSVGNPNYSIEVNYWAPFTLSGVGLHDASWRTNWASDAYLEHGSGGCVNTPPEVMKTVYDHLVQYEPVIIY